MKELTLQELKEIELEILIKFDAFCKENNIRYYLAFGTLLGAIRYKGFIPWDDDIDVLVPREDYERLLTIFQDSEIYRLYSIERNRKYAFPFAKLCDMRTKLVETSYPNNGVALGVNIDIFPLDHFSDDLQEAKREISRIKRYNAGLSYLKVDRPQTNNPIRFVAWSLIILCCKLLGSEYFIRKVNKECKKSSQVDSRYVGAKSWPIWGDRVIAPAEAFEKTIEIEFEGKMFPAPFGYDAYLTCLYGDYLPEPPKEKQKTHHFFTAHRV